MITAESSVRPRQVSPPAPEGALRRRLPGGYLLGRLGRGLVLAVAFVGLIGAPAPGRGDWPQWRGVQRDGAVAADAGRADWRQPPVELWRREVGQGYSGPVVAGDGVWIHTRQGDEEVVNSLRLGDGGLVWSRRYDAPFRQDPDALSHGRGPYSTPSVAGGRLFTFGITGILSAWDAATGKLLWRRESSAEFEPSFPFFGAAASPLVWGDLCFAHLGGHPRGGGDNPWRGAFVALAVADGGERWRWYGDGPALGASPLIHDVEGRPQLVFKSLANVVGLEPRTGKELWRIPYKVAMDNTIVTPFFVGDRLLLSDYEMGVSAWQIRSQGDLWTARQLWKNREVSLFMSSPVATGGQVVGFSHFRKGQLFGLDPSDGDLLWRGEPKSGDYASLISWGNELLVFLEDGTLVVGEVSADGWQPFGRFRLGSTESWSHPAVAAGRLVIKDGSQLAVFRAVTPPGPRGPAPSAPANGVP